MKGLVKKVADRFEGDPVRRFAYLVSTTGDTGQEQATEEALQETLAMLRALHWHYWTCHWQVKGDPFYSDHELFDRLYSGDIIAEIDGIAEKLVGYFGVSPVNAVDSMDRAMRFLKVWEEAEPNCLFRRSLHAERQLQIWLRNLYDSLKGFPGMLTLGLDDFLMSLASAHETNVYLLQQRTDGHKMAGDISLTNMERTWGGYSSFGPRRHAEDGEEEEEGCSCQKEAGRGARLDPKQRSAVNKDLVRAGLDGNGRFRKAEDGWRKTWDVLAKHGIEVADIIHADHFRTGRFTANIAFSNPDDSFSPVDILNSTVVFAATELQPNRYEVLVYLS